MSIPGSALPLLLASPAGAAAGYEIERSLRFNSADSAYLNRTPSSAGNRKTWTWAGWVKRSSNISLQYLFSAGSNTSNNFFIRYSAGQLQVADINSGAYSTLFYFTPEYRDFSAWQHIVLVVDTDNATQDDRIKLYINSIRQPFTYGTACPSGLTTNVNTASTHAIGGSHTHSNYYFNGYLADVHFVDGQALDPTDFGEFDDNNVWQPIEYAGTYGTNGFYLPLNDNSSASALGTDTSGNGNDWTVNNISVASGAGNDSLRDSPTNGNTANDTGAGGEVPGNYATLNPLARYPVGGTFYTPTNGNLEINLVSISQTHSTLAPSTGKWYAEFVMTGGTVGTDTRVGIQPPSENAYVGLGALSYAYRSNGNIVNGATGYLSYGSTWGVNDVMGCALDLDNGKVWWSINGVWQASGDPAAGTNAAFTGISGNYAFAILNGNSATYNKAFVANFGQRPFSYSAPSGFKALCTANLDTPTIEDASTAMDVALYTGNGGTQTISGLGFSPDFIWIKSRSKSAQNHALYDTVRGRASVLISNSTDGEFTGAPSTDDLTSFNSDGFGVGPVYNMELNLNTQTYVAWTWDAGSSTVANTDGSISSSVRANPTAGFSIVSYTGNNAASGTIGHGLGVKPDLIIVKRTGTGGNDWGVYHSALGATENIDLNNAGGKSTTSGVWNNTEPTSSVFTVGTFDMVNAADTYIAYCFAPVEGYSAFGSYTGNGSSDGPFVYTGFRPKVIITKAYGTTSSWGIWDTERDTYNATDATLYPNLNNSEETTGAYPFDILSNGFKVRNTANFINATSGVIYMAWAESPFKYARAR